MRTMGRWAVATALLLATSTAADPYDFRIGRLGQDPNFPDVRFDYRANARFAYFAHTLAAALTSANLAPPETLGHAGFMVSPNLSWVHLSSPRGAEDFVLPTQSQAGIPGSVLVPSLHVRKGLPWSFEVGTRVGWLEKSRMAALTIEGKWSLNEGFAWLPDVGLRGFGTRLVNTKDFDLTAAGFDLGLGKQFAIGGMITLTPYVGWNPVFVAASTGSVDLEPERDYRASLSSPNEQLRNTEVFDPLDITETTHQRFYGGLRFIGGALQLGIEYSHSALPRLSAPERVEAGAPYPTTAPPAQTIEVPAVTAWNFSVGLDF